MIRNHRAGLALGLLLCLASCTSPRAPRVKLHPDELWRLYEEAVAVARYPRSQAISTRLVPITRDTPGLRWDDQGRVLMATWTKAKYYEGSAGKRYTFKHSEVWLTAVPYVQSFCRELRLSPDRLDLRLEQLLGLPPSADYDVFVQLWIDPRDFFRPCADPEINDRECTLSLTVDRAPEGERICPWIVDYYAGQVSAKWVTVTREHLDWMCGTWTKTYPADPRKAYPWTGLGYTYDWGRRDPVGASEFVAPQGTTVVIESVTPTAEYCKRKGPGGPGPQTKRTD